MYQLQNVSSFNREILRIGRTGKNVLMPVCVIQLILAYELLYESPHFTEMSSSLLNECHVFGGLCTLRPSQIFFDMPVLEFKIKSVKLH